MTADDRTPDDLRTTGDVATTTQELPPMHDSIPSTATDAAALATPTAAGPPPATSGMAAHPFDPWSFGLGGMVVLVGLVLALGPDAGGPTVDVTRAFPVLVLLLGLMLLVQTVRGSHRGRRAGARPLAETDAPDLDPDLE